MQKMNHLETSTNAKWRWPITIRNLNPKLLIIINCNKIWADQLLQGSVLIGLILLLDCTDMQVFLNHTLNILQIVPIIHSSSTSYCHLSWNPNTKTGRFFFFHRNHPSNSKQLSVNKMCSIHSLLFWKRRYFNFKLWSAFGLKIAEIK